jgi:hypothetical protein
MLLAWCWHLVVWAALACRDVEEDGLGAWPLDPLTWVDINGLTRPRSQSGVGPKSWGFSTAMLASKEATKLSTCN